MKLEIDERLAQDFTNALEHFQIILSKILLKPVLIERDFTSIKTMNDVYATIPISRTAKKWIEDLPDDELAYKQLKLIRNAIDPDFVTDCNNSNQPKCYPWFDMSAGFGFGSSCYRYTNASTGVGSRLCFSTKEKSDHAGKQFIEVWKRFLK